MNFDTLEVKYKYSVMMPPATNTVSHIKTRLLENYEKVVACKFEYLVSSIYEDAKYYYWQPFFDFDTTNSSQVKLFLRTEISKKYFDDFYVEVTKNGYHIVSTLAYGPLTSTSKLDDIKKKFKAMFSAYADYDWAVSCRETPNRRCFCRVSPKKIIPIISAKKFLDMNHQEIRSYSNVFLNRIKNEHTTYRKIVSDIIFPNKLVQDIASVFVYYWLYLLQYVPNNYISLSFYWYCTVLYFI